MDFLTKHQSLLDSGHEDKNFISAKDKDVIAIGGGDTGTDCIGTSLRHGCRSLVNFELFPQPPSEAENNPWPTWRRFSHRLWSQRSEPQDGQDPRRFSISSLNFEGTMDLCARFERSMSLKSGK